MSPSRPGHDEHISFEEAATLTGIKDDLEDYFGIHEETVLHLVSEEKKLIGRRVTITIERIDSDHDALMTTTVLHAITGYMLALQEKTGGKEAHETYRVNATTTMVVNAVSFEVETTNEDQPIGNRGNVEVR